MTVRALRGAVQLERDECEHLLDRIKTLISELLHANDLGQDDLISMVFTATPDLCSGFPAAAARELGMIDVPLLCAQELDIVGALPRVVRIMAHVDTELARADIQHVYMGGAAVLRQDLQEKYGRVKDGRSA